MSPFKFVYVLKVNSNLRHVKFITYVEIQGECRQGFDGEGGGL